jgi:hypothetical protein
MGGIIMMGRRGGGNEGYGLGRRDVREEGE